MSCNVTIIFSGGRSNSIGFAETCGLAVAAVAGQGYTIESATRDGQLFAWPPGIPLAAQAKPTDAQVNECLDGLFAKQLPTHHEVTDHRVNSLNRSIKIEALGEPGVGGACSRYRISGVQGPLDHHPIPTTYIKFQDGDLQKDGANGHTNEAYLAVLIDRLRGFQSGKFSCRENAIAITKLEEVQHWLAHRTRAREAAGIEGTHTV